MGSAQSQVRLASAFNTNVDERLASPWKCRSSEGAALECSPIIDCCIRNATFMA
jgi:hypothetical protein